MGTELYLCGVRKYGKIFLKSLIHIVHDCVLSGYKRLLPPNRLPVPSEWYGIRYPAIFCCTIDSDAEMLSAGRSRPTSLSSWYRILILVGIHFSRKSKFLGHDATDRQNKTFRHNAFSCFCGEMPQGRWLKLLLNCRLVSKGFFRVIVSLDSEYCIVMLWLQLSHLLTDSFLLQ